MIKATGLLLLLSTLAWESACRKTTNISDMQAAASVSTDTNNYISLRQEVGTQLRQRLSANINDATFNQILEDVLSSIHRFSRPRYGRSLRLPQQRDPSDKKEWDKRVEEVSRREEADKTGADKTGADKTGADRSAGGRDEGRSTR